MKQVFRLLVGEGFRVFFLGAGVFGFLSMFVWITYQVVLNLGGNPDFPTAMSPHLWHGHEMIFGYGGAALGGFFLTAVPNWTGAKAAPHRFIAFVAGLWIAGRVVVWMSGVLPPVAVAVIDLSFAPVLGAKIASQLLRKPKPQNMVFLLFLTFFWTANLLVHLEWMDVTKATAGIGLRGGLMALVGMIIVLGGRVTPAFTRNAMHRAGIESGTPSDPKLFTPLAIGLAATLPLVAMLSDGTVVSGVVYLAAGIFTLVRVGVWHTRFQWSQPILWSLHLSCASVGAGLVLKGLAPFTSLSEVAGLHFIAISGVGGMTFAVMARASLGHAGLALVAARPVAFGFVALPLAGIVRWAGGTFGGEFYALSIWMSGGFWLVAFTGFLAVYVPIFTTPRAPRAPVGPPPSS
ncbi:MULTISPECIES: NnrS family protein [Alphaproteobacteria]|uniref:NnrS family protein n=1 Tax=Alphaproteobacteria TaxID=28211 RepID=UPI003A8D46FE